MPPKLADLIGFWVGLIVHKQGATPVSVHLDRIQNGSLRGTYSFPDPQEKRGVLTAELSGTWLFIKSQDKQHGKINSLLHIVGAKSPEMMYGTIPRAKDGAHHSTVTMFRARNAKEASKFVEVMAIKGIWQIFRHKDL